jgi:hypothetical protein
LRKHHESEVGAGDARTLLARLVTAAEAAAGEHERTDAEEAPANIRHVEAIGRPAGDL